MEPDREPLVLHAGAGQRPHAGPQLARQVGQARPLPLGLRVPEGDPPPLHLEAVAAGVDQLGDAHAGADIVEGPTRQHSDLHAGRPGQRTQVLARRRGEFHLGRIGRERRERSVEVREEQEAAAGHEHLPEIFPDGGGESQGLAFPSDVRSSTIRTGNGISIPSVRKRRMIRFRSSCCTRYWSP